MIYGSKRVLEKEAKLSIHNRFDIEVVDAKTNTIKQKAVAHNIICKKLWEYVCGNGSYFKYIHYGTGSGVPSENDTSLFSFGGYLDLSPVEYSIDDAAGVVSARRKGIMLETVAVGSLLSEVGIAYNTGSATLCTHAMLKDANGNQITIQKTAQDIINIYATVFVHFNPNGYDNGAIKFLQRSSQTEVYAIFDAYGGGLFAHLLGMVDQKTSYAQVRAHPKGNLCFYSYSDFQRLTWEYDLANKTIKATMKRLAASQNLSTISISLSNSTVEYIDVDVTDIVLTNGNAPPDTVISITDESTWFPKYDITSEAIGTGDGATQDFNTKFGYVTSPHVFIDGTELVTGVTVTLNTPLSNAKLGGESIRVIDASGVPLSDSENEGVYKYVENLDYLTRKVTSVAAANSTLSGSNDLSDWTDIPIGFDYNYMISKDMPTNAQNYRYYRLRPGTNYRNKSFFTLEGNDFNIHFDTPPAEGSVITASYKTSGIPKDVNHVFDFSLTIQLGEYTQ